MTKIVGVAQQLRVAIRAEHELKEEELMDFCRRSAAVLADEDCVALELTPADLRHVGAQDLEQFAMIYMNMGRELCRRLRAADERLFQAKIEVGLSTDEYAFPSI